MKYGNIPTPAVDGKLKHSKHEATVGNSLIAAYRAGAITELQPDPDDPKSRQPRFGLHVFGTPAVEALLEFIETTGESTREVTMLEVENLARLVKEIRMTKQKVTTYVADYTYIDEHGAFHVVDPKGYRTRVFALKKKLMLVATGHEIEEL